MRKVVKNESVKAFGNNVKAYVFISLLTVRINCLYLLIHAKRGLAWFKRGGGRGWKWVASLRELFCLNDFAVRMCVVAHNTQSVGCSGSCSAVVASNPLILQLPAVTFTRLIISLASPFLRLVSFYWFTVSLTLVNKAR